MEDIKGGQNKRGGGITFLSTWLQEILSLLKEKNFIIRKAEVPPKVESRDTRWEGEEKEEVRGGKKSTNLKIKPRLSNISIPQGKAEPLVWKKKVKRHPYTRMVRPRKVKYRRMRAGNKNL